MLTLISSQGGSIFTYATDQLSDLMLLEKTKDPLYEINKIKRTLTNLGYVEIEDRKLQRSPTIYENFQKKLKKNSSIEDLQKMMGKSNRGFSISKFDGPIKSKAKGKRQS